MSRTGRVWLAFVCLGTLVLVLIALPLWVMTAPAIPYSAMDKLHLGMSDGEVEALLGTPDDISVPPKDGRTQWRYERGTWAIYYIKLDADGRLVDHWHDF